MTNKDYERAATIVQIVARSTDDPTRVCTVEEAFIDLFQANGNPRFDEARFRRACVPGANVRARPRRVTA